MKCLYILYFIYICL